MTYASGQRYNGLGRRPVLDRGMIAERQDDLPRSTPDDVSTRRYRQHSARISITSVDLHGHMI